MACKQTQDQAGIKSYLKSQASLNSDQELGQAVEGDRSFFYRVGEGVCSLSPEYPDSPLTCQY